MLPPQRDDRLCSDPSPEVGRSGVLGSFCAATETFPASSPSSGNHSRSERLKLPLRHRLLRVSHATKAHLRFSSADGTAMISAKDKDCKDGSLGPSASSRHHFWVTLRTRGWGGDRSSRSLGTLNLCNSSAERNRSPSSPTTDQTAAILWDTGRYDGLGHEPGGGWCLWMPCPLVAAGC